MEDLVAELSPGKRLSSAFLKPCDDVASMFRFAKTVLNTEDEPLHVAATTTLKRGKSMSDAVFDTCPQETYADKLDGEALVCVVLALNLLSSESAVRARDKGCVTDRDELELVFGATDTLPVRDDPDAVQCALVSFVRGDVLERCRYDLFVAAYQVAFHPSAETYPNLVALHATCAAFLSDVDKLLSPPPAPTVADMSSRKKKKTKSAPSSPKKQSVDGARVSFAASANSSRSSSPRPTLVSEDSTDATKAFYAFATANGDTSTQIYTKESQAEAPVGAGSTSSVTSSSVFEEKPRTPSKHASVSPFIDNDFDLVAALTFASKSFSTGSTASATLVPPSPPPVEADDDRAEFDRKLLAALDLL